MRDPDGQTYVTHSDLDAFKRDVRIDLASIREDFKTFSKEIRDVLGGVGKTNWTAILGLISVILVLVGMAAALIGSLLTGQARSQALAVQSTDNKLLGQIARLDVLAISHQRELDLLRDDHKTHTQEADHPYGVLSKIEHLEGVLQILTDRIQDIDTHGSRAWIPRAPTDPPPP